MLCQQERIADAPLPLDLFCQNDKRVIPVWEKAGSEVREIVPCCKPLAVVCSLFPTGAGEIRCVETWIFVGDRAVDAHVWNSSGDVCIGGHESLCIV